MSKFSFVLKNGVMLPNKKIVYVPVNLPEDPRVADLYKRVFTMATDKWPTTDPYRIGFKRNITHTYDLQVYYLGVRNITITPFFKLWRVTSSSGGAAPVSVKPETWFIPWGTMTINPKMENVSIKLSFGYMLLYGTDTENSITIEIDTSGISSVMPQANSLLSSSVDTRILILASSEPLYGQNLSSVLFRSAQGEWIHVPNLTSVVRGHACTLLGKYASPELKGVLPDNLEEYAMLRYFLWYLIADMWDITVLLQSRTIEFFTALRNSPYNVWLLTFDQPKYSGYYKYFKS